MGTTILYKLFRIGSIPKKMRTALESESIVLSQEGISGRQITLSTEGLSKKGYINSNNWFSGSIIITKKRVVFCTFSTAQIDLSINGPRLSLIYAKLVEPDILIISFDSKLFQSIGLFNDEMGIIELQYNTAKAQEFFKTLTQLGVQQGQACAAG